MHLSINISQGEHSFVQETNLLRMRLLHCLIQAWKLAFSKLPDAWLKAYLERYGQIPAGGD